MLDCLASALHASAGACARATAAAPSASTMATALMSMRRSLLLETSFEDERERAGAHEPERAVADHEVRERPRALIELAFARGGDRAEDRLGDEAGAREAHQDLVQHRRVE